MGLDDFMTVIPNQGYHLETVKGYPSNVGDAEREEEQRCELIEAQISERQRKERRNFKGY